MKMFRITVDGVPFGEALDEVTASARAIRLTASIKGIGMMRVLR